MGGERPGAKSERPVALGSDRPSFLEPAWVWDIEALGVWKGASMNVAWGAAGGLAET